MGYILIFLGIASIIGGIVFLSLQKSDCSVNTSENVNESLSISDDTDKIKESNSLYGVKAAKNSEPTTKEVGDDFEDFVVNLLADYRLSLIDRTQDAMSSAGVVAESCKNPDLHVKQKHKNSEIDYYIECKYRSNWYNNAIHFEDWQIERYKKFQRNNHRKVIIALGVGGTPKNPEIFRLVPLDSIHNNLIRKIDTHFTIEPTSSALVEYMDNYFELVFNKANSRKKK